MADDLTVRQFRPGDGQRVRELNETALRSVDAYAEDAPEGDLRDVPGHYLDGDGEFLVGELDDTVVAMGALQPADRAHVADRVLDPADGPAAELTRMRVAPEHQRQGFGTQLLVALEDRAAELGYEVLVLDTTARQRGARALYASFGYEEVERFDWRDYEMLLYRKALG
jgi:GNAT superfamily N-acetyltransferase